MKTIIHLTSIVNPDHRHAGRELNFRLAIDNGVLKYSLKREDTQHVTSQCGALGFTGDVTTWHNVGSFSLRDILPDWVDGIERDERKAWLKCARHVTDAYGYDV